MNILKALEGLSAGQDGTNEAQPQTVAAKPQPPSPQEHNVNIPDTPNVMARVIERHERISNRVRTNAKK